MNKNNNLKYWQIKNYDEFRDLKKVKEILDDLDGCYCLKHITQMMKFIEKIEFIDLREINYNNTIINSCKICFKGAKWYLWVYYC